MSSRRILLTGLSTYWGGRLAQALERDRDIDVIIGVDSEDPTRELDRTEFVRVGTQHALLRRIVEATEIDTVVDARLVVDSATTTPQLVHENNVIGTMNILAACSGPDTTVRKLVFKSSAHYYGTAQDDPAFFTEQMGRPHPPATPIERDILDAEAAVAEFADQNPDTVVSVLRCTNVLGPDVRTSHTALFSLPAVPMILGFDPRYQLVHEDDVVGALAHATTNDLPGIYNVAADGVLALSEVAGLLGKPYLPLLPPWGTGLATGVLSRLGISIPPEMLSQLRFGRGLDNRRFKATGFIYRYTTREAVIKLREHMRLDPILRGGREPYHYEREVEDFLRWSPHVRNPAYRREARLTPRQIHELEKLLAEQEVGGQRSEVRGRGSEVGGRRSEVGGQRSEVRGRRSDRKPRRARRGRRSSAMTTSSRRRSSRCSARWRTAISRPSANTRRAPALGTALSPPSRRSSPGGPPGPDTERVAAASRKEGCTKLHWLQGIRLFRHNAVLLRPNSPGSS